MSTARFNTLENAAGTKSVPVATVVDGSAKAWVNFNGTGTVAIRSSFNVSSITDLGVGTYRVNFTSALADANFAWSGSVAVSGTTDETAGVQETFSSGKSTTSLQFYAGTNNLRVDYSAVHIVIFR